ncbi:MAG: hypothetical protein HYT70_04585 [Candidatus Aenigmarchaeota archaeon]|nr:hypothetical protein [Candidatus Aenigmarchaeota archaeon]
MPTIVVATSIEEALHELANYLVPIEQSKFSQLGCYGEPLRSNRQVELKGRGSLVGDDGTIRLNLPEQILFFNLLDSKYGPLEHGNLERQLRAAYSPEGQSYKDNVLALFWVYTGEVGIKLENGHVFGRAVKVEPIPTGISTGTVVFEDESQAQPSPGDYKFTLNRSGVYVPTDIGRFDQIGEAEGNGYWHGVYPDSQGRSVVRCGWDSGDGGFGADAYGLLVRAVATTLGTWRKAA